jgi:predicted PurR-regulated permease PerM
MPGGEAAPTQLPLRTPIDVRSASVALLAALASVYTLRWASAVFIPLLLGLMLSYALSPLVDRLQRWRVPRVLAAAALLLSLLGGLGFGAYALADDATALLASLPDAAQKLGDALKPTRGAPESPMQKVQRAAAQLEQAAQDSGPAPAAAKGVTRVQIERPHFKLTDYLLSGTLGLAGAASQTLVVGCISFFLMCSGNSFRRKMVRIAGPAFSQKKITLQVLDEITGQIHRYLMVQLATSVGVGIVTWLALLWIGLDRAAVWGVAAGVLNLVPYLGAIVVTGGLALVGFVQFGSPGPALLVGGVSLLIHTVSGQLLTPWLTSRASSINPVVIFVGVLAWGWLWGLWGLLLGVPLLMVVKAVCDRVEDLKAIGELLGD